MRLPILSHLGTGVMALILAVILWAFAYMENQEEAQVHFRVQFAAPEGISVVPESKAVDFEVRGARRLVEAFRNENSGIIKKQIDPDAVAKLGSVNITREDVPADKRLTIVNLPMAIELTVSREETVELPLRFHTFGTPAPGYVFSAERSFVRPSTVKVTGPKSILDKADAIYTQRVDITGLWIPFSWPTGIVTVMDGQPVKVDATGATIYVAFDAKRAQKTLEDVPVQLLVPPAYPYKLTLNRTTVAATVEGPEQALATLSPAEVVVFVAVKLDDVPRDLPYTRVPTVTLPPGFTAKLDPTDVDFTVSAQ